MTHTESRAEPPPEAFADAHAIEVLARESAERVVEALELQAERDGEAVYEHLRARWCRYGCCTIFHEVMGHDIWLRTREQAIAYVTAKKLGSPW